MHNKCKSLKTPEKFGESKTLYRDTKKPDDNEQNLRSLQIWHMRKFRRTITREEKNKSIIEKMPPFKGTENLYKNACKKVNNQNLTTAYKLS